MWWVQEFQAYHHIEETSNIIQCLGFRISCAPIKTTLRIAPGSKKPEFCASGDVPSNVPYWWRHDIAMMFLPQVTKLVSLPLYILFHTEEEVSVFLHGASMKRMLSMLSYFLTFQGNDTFSCWIETTSLRTSKGSHFITVLDGNEQKTSLFHEALYLQSLLFSPFPSLLKKAKLKC